MSNKLKNVSGRTLIMGELNLTWLKDRVFDLDDFDKDRLIKGFKVITNNINDGFLIHVDDEGNPLKKRLNVDLYKNKCATVSEEIMAAVELERMKDKPVVNINEINIIGDTPILGGKYALRPFLLLHHNTVVKRIKEYKWEIDDLSELEMIRRHENRSYVKDEINKIIARLKRNARNN